MAEIMHIVGARPNFMKAAPVIRALEGDPDLRQVLVHTGQHYDRNMSEVFFDELGMPEPDVNLEVGSGSHATQTAEIMMRFEPVLIAQRPDLLLVYGDVNSTIACSLVAAKLGVKVGHVEAGLRSRDRGMPEEINRVLTDQLSDYFFTPSPDGDENLMREGIGPEKIFRIGNLMIDTLVRLLEQASPPDIPGRAEDFALVTLHRPSNVDRVGMLSGIMDTLSELSADLQMLFPVHPRTRNQIVELGLEPKDSHCFKLLNPLGYLEFLWLQQHAKVVITDSGGIQEESTCLQVPCLTLRENTERPITCEIGSNILVGADMNRLRVEVGKILAGQAKQGAVPDLWDGRSGERVAKIIRQLVPD